MNDETNAFFAPFEYYDGDKIVGVDVDIMNLVGEKLGKKVVFENTDFGVIIDNVKKGKKYDCGAAGITITDARKELVDFSDTYFTSIQYIVFKNGDFTKAGTTTDGVDYVLWSDLAGKKIGVQTDTTSDIYVDGEINGWEGENDGELSNTGCEEVRFDNSEVAIDALGITVDVVVVDKLPAEYMVNKNSNISCFALYYDAETATAEDYAIAVTKGNKELLDAINLVLEELGNDGINDLVAKHLGITG
ncbi:MAG: transporter substrate-binding domain-containing protein [Firmicutes bacterium]|nr:transporter substrate-binding domain-containing protein [Candidatus Caballimonas caccae]